MVFSTSITISSVSSVVSSLEISSIFTTQSFLLSMLLFLVLGMFSTDHKTAEKFKRIGFDEVASEDLVSKMSELERFKADKRLDTLTREQIKDMQSEITNFIKELPISKEGKAAFLSTIKDVKRIS